MLCRITGTVLDVSERSGNRKSDNQPFSIRTVRVLVANRDVCEFSLPDSAGKVAEGEILDVLARPSVYNGLVQFRALEEFPAEYSDLVPA